MSLTPAFEIGVWNAWIFMSVFLLQWLAVSLAGNRLAQRTGRPPNINRENTGWRISQAATVTWLIATFYSIFLPFHIGTVWFYAGLGVFLIGLVILVIATLNFAKAAEDKPTTAGAYCYSRHPMYVSMFLIYLGVSLAAASWLFFLLTIVTIFLARAIAIIEERCCLENYGDAYRAYMNGTPRWLGMPKSGNN